MCGRRPNEKCRKFPDSSRKTLVRTMGTQDLWSPSQVEQGSFAWIRQLVAPVCLPVPISRDRCICGISENWHPYRALPLPHNILSNISLLRLHLVLSSSLFLKLKCRCLSYICAHRTPKNCRAFQKSVAVSLVV
jgi:hypothetical protein